MASTHPNVITILLVFSVGTLILVAAVGPSLSSMVGEAREEAYNLMKKGFLFLYSRLPD